MEIKLKHILGIAVVLAGITTALTLNCIASTDGKTLQKPITESSFCMHVHSHQGYEKAFASAPFGLFRTWDSSVGWPQIQPEKDKWDWSLLDNFVLMCRERNIRIIMTLGMTPRWAAKNPEAPTPYGGNWSSSPPRDLADWESFTRTVAERNEKVYGGAIRYWEIWNEPDNTQPGYYFYTGTVEEMIEMARAARTILKAASPENKILSPGITQVGTNWLERFIKDGGWEAIDIAAVHYYWVWYPMSVTDFAPLMNRVRKLLDGNGCTGKPIWVTETGFDVNGFKTQERREVALLTTLLAPRYYGAEVVCAYSLNNNIFTNLYDEKRQKPTVTAAAYIELRKWLVGATIKDIRTGKSNTKICTLVKNGSMARIVWRFGTGSVKFKIDGAWGDKVFRLNGTVESPDENGKIRLGNSPILITDEKYL